MREELISAINEAIKNNATIRVTLETNDFNGITLDIIPQEIIDEEDNLVIAFNGTDVITIETNTIFRDGNEYSCVGESSAITVGF